MKHATLGAVGLAVMMRAALAAQPAPPPAPPCDPAEGYICGQRGPEDLITMGSQWAVASALAGSGGIEMIRLRDRTSHTVWPSPQAQEAHDAAAYPGCPGPPRGAFTTHGVYVPPGEGPRHRLFVVGHGARESIEIFDVDASGAVPVLTWTGCVIAPEPIGLNSVRSLPDGGFLTTNFLPRGESMQTLVKGEPNGELWEWHADTGWQKVPGSEASGANGVELSDDGRTLYIAAWGSQSFIRLSRGENPPKREEIPLGFRIDNIHWSKDGKLIGAGQVGPADGVGQDWRVVKIDPRTLQVETVHEQRDMPGFGGGTVAIEVGDALWVGSYRGDRIAIVRP